MARGGRRAGNKGTAYPNRTDLQGAQLPVDAPRGLPYGDRAKLIAAQRQVPMGPPPSGAVQPPQGQAPPGPVPGQVVPGGITGPTARPQEPVTAGLPIGPGAGPEALQNVAGTAHQNVASLLTSLAQAPGATTEVKELAGFANSGRA